tara:strand:- start:9684 stop:10682 length:999 start_codon:yes stop_codon:yes gene_type:complete
LNSLGIASSPFLSKSEINLLLKSANNNIQYARTGKYPFIRIYDPMLPWRGKLNLFGCDFPFSNMLPSGNDLFKEINFEKMIDIARDSFSKPELDSITLARLHWNGLTAYRGGWHRDGLKNDNDADDIICVLYLKDEYGFKIIDSNLDSELKNYGVPTIDNSIQPSIESNKIDLSKIQTTCSTKAGDLLMFKSGLLHRGCVNGRRLHLHMRLTSSKYLSNERNKLITFSKVKSFFIDSTLEPDFSHSKSENIQSKRQIALQNPLSLLSIFSGIRRSITYMNPFPQIKWIKEKFSLSKDQKGRYAYSSKATIYIFILRSIFKLKYKSVNHFSQE